MMAEIWKPVVGYRGLYEVSSLGRVRSLDKLQAISGPRRGRIRKLVPIGADKDKYLSVMLSRAGRVRCFRVHTLVLEAFVGKALPGEECRHLNGKRCDNRRRNLKWGSPKQNGQDRCRHGTQFKGETHPLAKLTVCAVRTIRALCAAKALTQAAIARRFKISQGQVWRIKEGLRWRSA